MWTRPTIAATAAVMPRTRGLYRNLRMLPPGMVTAAIRSITREMRDAYYLTVGIVFAIPAEYGGASFILNGEAPGLPARGRWEPTAAQCLTGEGPTPGHSPGGRCRPKPGAAAGTPRLDMTGPGH